MNQTGLICSGEADSPHQKIPASTRMIKSLQLKGNSLDSDIFSLAIDCQKSNLLLPNYVRCARVMDHILRTSSSLYSLLGADLNNVSVSRELFYKTGIYLQVITHSPYFEHMPKADIELVQSAMRDAEKTCDEYRCPLVLSDYFMVIRNVKHSLLNAIRSRWLFEKCSSKLCLFLFV